MVMLKLNLRNLSKWEEYIVNYLIDDYIDLAGKDLSGIELTIHNVQSMNCPITCPRRLNLGQREDFVIYLNNEPEHWCQMIYQLAHELGHLFMDCYPERKSLRWIDECLCELFSIIFLTRSTSFFQTFSPRYMDSVKSYISDHLNKALSYSSLPCSDFVAHKIIELESDPTEEGVNGRPRNCFIAANLFKVVGYDGEGISAVCIFKKLGEAESSKEFFDIWQSKCRTDSETYFVKTIRETLGL